MGDLEGEMTEIVEMEERMVALNSTEGNIYIYMKLLDELVAVAAETNIGHREGVATGNSNATEGAPQGAIC